VVTYLGQAEAAMDEKNRLTIPKAFREDLAKNNEEGVSEIWIVPGYRDFDFQILDRKRGEQFAASVQGKTIGGGGAAAKMGVLLEFSARVEVDKAGRALIPAWFIRRHKLEGISSFVITGSGHHLRVYRAEKWDKKLSTYPQEDIDAFWDEFQTEHTASQPIAGTPGSLPAWSATAGPTAPR
jgi:DNA-binding transcriptional regulator/RsmH inhibitor MraZ